MCCSGSGSWLEMRSPWHEYVLNSTQDYEAAKSQCNGRGGLFHAID